MCVEKKVCCVFGEIQCILLAIQPRQYISDEDTLLFVFCRLFWRFIPKKAKFLSEMHATNKTSPSTSSASQATGSQPAQVAQFGTSEVRNLPCFNPREDPNTLSVRWKRWRHSFELYLLAKGVSDDKQKVALLLHISGTDLQYLYYTLAGGAEELKP